MPGCATSGKEKIEMDDKPIAGMRVSELASALAFFEKMHGDLYILTDSWDIVGDVDLLDEDGEKSCQLLYKNLDILPIRPYSFETLDRE